MKLCSTLAARDPVKVLKELPPKHFWGLCVRAPVCEALSALGNRGNYTFISNGVKILVRFQADCAFLSCLISDGGENGDLCLNYLLFSLSLSI